MARKSKRKRARRTPSRRGRSAFRWRVAQVMILLGCVLAAYVMWLDFVIQSRFEGRRWALPARVYARPTEVYAGARLSPAELERALAGVGYRSSDTLTGPGQYVRNNSSVDLLSRPFDFWDGRRPSRRIQVAFNANGVAGITDLNTSKPVGIFRLEPQLIGKIYPVRKQDRVLVRLRDVPPALVGGLVAVEDRHFYTHPGIDIKGMLRALWVDIKAGRLAEGGSTLTQQLVKNYFLDNKRTFWRKINEIIMALLLEKHYAKKEILDAYINEVYLGQHGSTGIRGFGTASEFYFRRPLLELRVDQVALLIGLVRGASYYDPRRHPRRAVSRRNLVLDLMCKRGVVSCQTADTAKLKPLDVAPTPLWTQAKFPTFIDLVHRELLHLYRPEDLSTQGLRIFTTIDPQLQERIAADVQSTVSRLEREYRLRPGTLQTSLVVADPSDGEVVAALGGRADQYGDFDRALDARRPIGSLVKPFIYLTALERPARFNLVSPLDDSALSVRQPDGKVWKPENYDRRTHGHVPVLEALAKSYNIATVRLGLELGLDKVIDTLHAAGYKGSIPAYPATLLGAIDASPLEIAQMYQVLANGGFKIELNGVREVLDQQGRALKRHDLELSQALNPKATFLTDFLLTKVVELGTAHQLSTGFANRLPLAGKTGTTNDLRDSWFAGFGNSLLAAVWLGRDDNHPTKFTGATGAMRIWSAVMKAARIEPLTMPAPAGIGWDRNVGLKFDGRCLTVPALPYAKPYRPGDSLAC